MFRNWLRKHLRPTTFDYLKRVRCSVLAWIFQNNLNRLAQIFHTDK